MIAFFLISLFLMIQMWVIRALLILCSIPLTTARDKWREITRMSRSHHPLLFESLLQGHSIIPVFLCTSTSIYLFIFLKLFYLAYWQKLHSHYSTTSPLWATQPQVPVPNSVLSLLLPLLCITVAQSPCFTSRSTNTSNCQRLSFLLSH